MDDSRYKSLKNDYESCLCVCSYEPYYYDPRAPLYMMDVIYLWLTGWIKDSFPTMYSRRTRLFDVQDDLTPLIADHFIAMEGYAYKFDPSPM